MPRLNFTKKALDNLPVPDEGKRASYTDTKVSGLELRVTSKGGVTAPGEVVPFKKKSS